MLNRDASIEGRAKRSPNGKEPGGNERARAVGFGEVFGICFLLMVAVPALGVVSLPGWRVSKANTAGFGWEANEVRWAGLRDHERRKF